MEREKEQQKMIDNQIITNCLTALNIGSISELQIEEWLTLQCVPQFDLQRLTEAIKKEYRKQHPC